MLSTTTFEDIGPGLTLIDDSWRPYNTDEAGSRAFEAGRASMAADYRRIRETGGLSGQLQG